MREYYPLTKIGCFGCMSPQMVLLSKCIICIRIPIILAIKPYWVRLTIHSCKTILQSFLFVLWIQSWQQLEILQVKMASICTTHQLFQNQSLLERIGASRLSFTDASGGYMAILLSERDQDWNSGFEGSTFSQDQAQCADDFRPEIFDPRRAKVSFVLSCSFANQWESLC